MSMTALLLSVRNHLRSTIGFSESQCDCQIDGQPNPDVGDFFVTVHPLSKRQGATDVDHGVNKEFGIGITLTIRSADLPRDRNFENIFIGSMKAFDKYEDAIVNAIHKNFDVITAANTLITSTSYKFITPLEWQDSQQPPEPKDASWFFGNRPQDYGRNNEAGFAQLISFGGANILRCFD